MNLIRKQEVLPAEHGVIASYPDEFYGYFGWPTVARMPDGTLVAAASGLRNAHVCPFGRSVFMRSTDDGRTWTSPRVVNDSPLDDRDTGLVSCGGQRLLLTWFTTDWRASAERRMEDLDAVTRARWQEGMARVDDDNARRWVGAWCRTSEDAGETWSEPIRVPQTTPHGPIRLRAGGLLFLGKLFETDMAGFEGGIGAIAATRSDDGGRTWQPLGTVPFFEGSIEANYHEAHVAELPDGKLVGLIRFERGGGLDPEDLGLQHFMHMYTESTDGGRTWTTGGADGLPRQSAAPARALERGPRMRLRAPPGALRRARHDQPRRRRHLGVRLRPARRTRPRPGLPLQRRAGRRQHLHRLLPEAVGGPGQVRLSVEPLAAARRAS